MTVEISNLFGGASNNHCIGGYPTPVTRVGLVLGGGGVVGQAYHAGVLAAIEHDLGWDARQAEIIVGSSAGSVTGSLLRLGVAASELAEWWTDSPRKGPNESLLGELGRLHDGLPPFELKSFLHRWRLPNRALWKRMYVEPLAINPWAALATVMPLGQVALLNDPASKFNAPLPKGLWICGTERRAGRRVVFGSPQGPSATLFEAVSASCAIPAYFSPVSIEQEEYLDGGLASPTNADLLVNEPLDVVLVVSPMSGTDPLVSARPMRRRARHVLDGELRQLDQTQTISIVRFEPGPRAQRAMGLNFMATSRGAGVMRAAFFETGAHSGTSPAADSLRSLNARRAFLPAEAAK